MAKLNVVIPEVNVKVTQEDGSIVEYRKVERGAAVGDIVRLTDEDAADCSHLTYNGYYTVTEVDSAQDPHISDDDGDDLDLCAWKYEVYEKVVASDDYVTIDGQVYRKEKRAASVGEKVLVVQSFCYGKEGDIATVKRSNRSSEDVVTDKHTLMNDYRYVVLVPTSKQAKPIRLEVGDYAKVINISGTNHDSVKVGDIYLIKKDDEGVIPFLGSPLNPDAESGMQWFREKDTTRATDEELAAAKAALDPRNQFAKGDKVRLIAKGDRLNGYEVGKIYTVVEPLSEADRVKINGGTVPQGYAKAAELAKVTEEEIAQEALTAKWAAIGRKVNEYKRGDVVNGIGRVGTRKGNRYIGTVENLDDGDNPKGNLGIRTADNAFVSIDVTDLIAPVEQRFDRVG